MLRVVRAFERGERATDCMLVKAASPWTTYEKICTVNLGENETMMIAERRGISGDVVAIRLFALADASTKMEVIRSIQHPSFVTAHEIYQFKGKYYVVYEHMARSLQDVVGNPYLNDDRLAAIIGQIVEGLHYLEKRGLHHGRLSSSQVLLHPNGNVKIYSQEHCVSPSSSKDIKDLGYIMMELMQGYVKESPHVGLDEPGCWSPNAVNFLSVTTSASSTDELLKHPFLCSWQKKKLRGLFFLVMTWSRLDYEYVGWQNEDEALL
ncbi:hypothetical protein CEP51_015114 [Fusarium floridanum]|uniref:Protein kinase domain-containing protein n=1 Tax=Fusarium floridanum TaxID=1325733 RepID=A0A428PGB0_9HYPO|nr:hypothetical protein CEP51_015114 [Fusarium floridanum]